ncbi:MAG: UDP-N-acetylmuramoyl-L-alanyl-D-glutamate--2,6-diaminopimelate ligase [Omnitrophica bacterium RIFCSPHIGHO2_02_FULL_46_11]|nr:MAG: UDP-N-acetylmuramoyl-L-alanyl-D-glutamate--2,6-diaminopimelate ligase [Omnitrophica bacterium RIFCSPHIGHO2_02_FULL_46_11]
MKSLYQLLDKIPCSWNGKGELRTQIGGVHSDSRKVKRGDLFVAVSGFHIDGHSFIKEALKRGAMGVVSERFDPVAATAEIPQFKVSNSRAVLSQLVASAFDFPARKLRCIGITGTNGKTTTAFLIQYLLNIVSRAGLISTIYYDDGAIKEPAETTTPSPEVLNEAFARMVANRVSYCVMEVSSHALDQNRTEGIPFSSAVFTNLTQDHLDYHHDFDAYYQAKQKLFFSADPPKNSIINSDNAYGIRLIKECSKDRRVISYGIDAPCDYRAQAVRLSLKELHFDLIRKANRLTVTAPLLLRHNVYNILAALSVFCEEGFDLNDVLQHLSHFPGVPGRLERIEEGQDFSVFVDYAHTPDGLKNVLSSVQGFPRSRVISVFGCGGDRDRYKRPIMGEIVNSFSDIVILTSDNPRTERAEDILAEIKKGIDAKKGKLFVIVDRREAIRQAIELAEANDLVFIFGKGHETYQILGNDKIPFSDQEIARYYLKEKCSPSAKSQKLVVEN